MLIALTSALLFTASPFPAEAESEPPAGKTVLVKMLDHGGKMRFEPAAVTVSRGDVVRFVQHGDMPHNVEFSDRSLGIPTGPFVIEKGKHYDVKIDQRFREGTFEYVCTPHVAMGMKGSITVK